MLGFVARRLASALPTAFIALVLVFFIARILPGDPALAILGDSASEAAIAALRERMGLNRPIWEQFLAYMGDILRLDLGRSMVSGRPVVEDLLHALPFTLELTTFAIVFGVLAGVPLGTWAALRRGGVADHASRALSLVGVSFPPFFLGICLLLLLAILFPIFPVISADQSGTLRGRIAALVLPGLTLGIIFMAFVVRSTRAAMLEVIPEMFVRTARSKGIPESRVLLRHIVRNALLPIITVVGLYFGILMGNSVVTEIVFTRPGLGKMIVAALNSRDYVTLQGLTLVYCFIVIVVTFVTDVLHGMADPRVKPA
ncbi:MAG TPA: ABC transporter permease [Usitatibacter sp.]|nr:ABC transporter permease [Usitatibacter sp.]